MAEKTQPNPLLLLLDTVIFRPAFAHLSAGDEPLDALGALMLTKAVAWQVEVGEDAWFTRNGNAKRP